MNITLKVWRQAGAKAKGALVEYKATDVSPDMSFLEMLDVVNEGLIARGEVPIAFDHDCREGICGRCGVMINGVAHGPMKGTATCQLHMRSFKTATPSSSSRGGRMPSPWSRIWWSIAAHSIDHPGGRVRQCGDRWSKGRQQHSHSEDRRRFRDGCRGVHRLRRVRGGMSERIGIAVHEREDLASRPAAAGTA
jgi:hypothetical protein